MKTKPRRTKPRKYQIRCVNKIGDFNGRALIADEMGLGKTFEALLYAETVGKKARPVIVVCPASVKFNWQDECRMHFGLRSDVCEGRKAPRGRKIIKPAPVTIINPEILTPSWLRYLKRLNPGLIIGDEAHYFKNGKAQRTKNFKKLCKGVKRVLVLGGSPITQRTKDFWEMLHLLKPKKFDSKRHFLYRYCDPKPAYIGWDFNGTTNAKELNRKLRKYVMIRRLKKDVLKELPAKTRTIVKLGMRNRKEYEAASDNFIHWLRGISPGKAWRASKAQQYVRGGYLMRLAAEGKLPNVFEWLDNLLEHKKKVVVIAVHTKIIDMLHERYKQSSVIVNGKVTGRKRHAAIKQFQTDKRIKMIISQSKVAVGWNATAADVVVFVELDQVPVIMEQGIDRTHRMGQTKPVTAYFLVAHDTIEERYVQKAREIMQRFNAVMDGGDVGEDYSAFDAVIKELRNKTNLRRRNR